MYDEKGHSIELGELAANNNDKINNVSQMAYPVTLPTDMTGGKMKVTVNEVCSLNNENGNDAKGLYNNSIPNEVIGGDKTIYNNFYNRQPNGVNNNILTDDFIIDVWDLNTKAAIPLKSGLLTQPIMSINPVEKNVGFAFTNGSLDFSMGGKVNKTEYSSKYWLGGYDFYTSIGFTYDALGFSYGTAAGGDINGDGGVDRFRIMTDRWGIAQATKQGYSGNYNSNRLELIGQRTAEDSGYTIPYIEKDRIKSVSFASTVDESVKSTNLYMAYYDVINKEIRFKWGTFTKDKTKDNTEGSIPTDLKNSSVGKRGNADNNAGLFVDEYGAKSLSNDNGYGGTGNHAEFYRLNYVNVIAGDNTEAPTGVNQTSDYSTGYYAGEYVSIIAIPPESNLKNETGKDIVVAVWWDAENRELKYSYIIDPMKKTNNAFDYVGGYRYVNTNTSETQTTEEVDGITYTRKNPVHKLNGWTTPKTVFDQGIGEYCKIAVDGKGGIHIAAYDTNNLDVCYAYSDNYKGESFNTCTVDSYGVVGTEIGLDVTLDSTGTYGVPYITYYSNSCIRPKVAYLVSSVHSDGSTSDDMVTGSWETSVIPTNSTVTNDHNNVGLWKDSAGKITDSKNKDGAIGVSSATKNNCTIYGNGSATAILGYATKKGGDGYIETAQMRDSH